MSVLLNSWRNRAWLVFVSTVAIGGAMLVPILSGAQQAGNEGLSNARRALSSDKAAIEHLKSQVAELSNLPKRLHGLMAQLKTARRSQRQAIQNRDAKAARAHHASVTEHLAAIGRVLRKRLAREEESDRATNPAVLQKQHDRLAARVSEIMTRAEASSITLSTTAMEVSDRAFSQALAAGQMAAAREALEAYRDAVVALRNQLSAAR